MHVSGPPPKRFDHGSKNYFSESSSSTTRTKRQIATPSRPFSYRKIIIPDSATTRLVRATKHTVREVYDFSWQTTTYLRLASQSMMQHARSAVSDVLSSESSWRRKK